MQQREAEGTLLEAEGMQQQEGAGLQWEEEAEQIQAERRSKTWIRARGCPLGHLSSKAGRGEGGRFPQCMLNTFTHLSIEGGEGMRRRLFAVCPYI